MWGCSLACYTKHFLEAGWRDIEDTYVWMQFLPFEEADTNEALKAYVDSVGADKVDSFGAQAWQAAMAFKHVINEIVAEQGPNAITRAAILDGLAASTTSTPTAGRARTRCARVATASCCCRSRAAGSSGSGRRSAAPSTATRRT